MRPVPLDRRSSCVATPAAPTAQKQKGHHPFPDDGPLRYGFGSCHHPVSGMTVTTTLTTRMAASRPATAGTLGNSSMRGDYSGFPRSCQIETIYQIISTADGL